jgi:hypothetical protein
LLQSVQDVIICALSGIEAVSFYAVALSVAEGSIKDLVESPTAKPMEYSRSL